MAYIRGPHPPNLCQTRSEPLDKSSGVRPLDYIVYVAYLLYHLIYLVVYLFIIASIVLLLFKNIVTYLIICF